jgi:hypothetical protein
MLKTTTEVNKMTNEIVDNDHNQNNTFINSIKRNQRIIIIALFAILTLGTGTYLYLTQNAASNCTSTVCTNGYKWVYYFGIRFCVSC